MKTFKIGEYYIEANSADIAEKISELLAGKNHERCMIVKIGDSFQIFEIGENPIAFFTLEKKTVTYCGEAKSDSGSAILDAAVSSFEMSKKQAAKIASMTKVENRKRREEDDKKAIENFEATVPTNARILYDSIMSSIQATTDAYKLEIIEALVEVQIKPENWMSALVWFRDKILNNEDGKKALLDKSYYQLRAAFVTTVKSIVKSGAKTGSTMKGVANDGRSATDWLKYAAKNKS